MKDLKFNTIIIFVSIIVGIVAGCKSNQNSAEFITPETVLPQNKADENNPSDSLTIDGAGATFPYPLYSQLALKYNSLTGFKLNYQSIGSGGGIAQIKAKTVDFGASDAPLEQAELDSSGLIQFPMTIGGVVPVVNIDGIKAGEIKLSSEVLADIFLGNIKKWNDKAIKSINTDLTLPDQDITVVHRSDGSGTTWIFTNYLSKISKQWSDKIGTGKAVEWPAGVGGKGNEGVSAYVQRIKGSIGYVEFAYALQNNIPYVQLKNRDGFFVNPTIESFQAAASNADWNNAPGFYMVLTDQPGANSWPITGASFIIMYKNMSNIDKVKGMLKFFDWSYKHGSDIARELHYVPIPHEVVNLIEDMWNKQIKVQNQSVWP